MSQNEEYDTEIIDDCDEQEYPEVPKMASREKLYSLHDIYADYLVEQLESGEVLSSGTLAAIGAFLKNNNITTDIAPQNTKMNLTSRITALLNDSREDLDD
ncbi:MAG: hypothetical protein JHC33_09585 [Ignisphaera sp.]|nr:hypothetical protein [Ignisphaera sp.]